MLCWLMNFIEKLYNAVPKDLNFCLPDDAEIEILCLEGDEIWSFVESRKNKRWIWLIIERRTRQIIAVHIGDRSQESFHQGAIKYFIAHYNLERQKIHFAT